MCWKWSRGKAVKCEKVKGEEAGVLQKKYTSFLPHTHYAWKHMQTAACVDSWHASRTYACAYTPTHKLQSKFLQPDIMLLSIWLRGRERQIRREQRKGSEGRERWRSSSISFGGSAASVQLNAHTLNHHLAWRDIPQHFSTFAKPQLDRLRLKTSFFFWFQKSSHVDRKGFLFSRNTKKCRRETVLLTHLR